MLFLNVNWSSARLQKIVYFKGKQKEKPLVSAQLDTYASVFLTMHREQLIKTFLIFQRFH